VPASTPSPVPSLSKETPTKPAVSLSGDPPQPGTAPKKSRERHDSQDSTASESSTVSGASSASSAVRRDTDNRPDPGEGEEKEETVRKLDENGDPIEGEDTMKNLRKTFAGIFGDIA